MPQARSRSQNIHWCQFDQADRGVEISPEEEIALLRHRVALLERVLQTYPSGISVFDGDYNLVLCNAKQGEIFDYPETMFDRNPTTLEDMLWFNAQHGEYGEDDLETQVSQRSLAIRKGGNHRYERRRPNGDVLEVQGYHLPGGGFVSIYRDITEERHAQEMVSHMAQHDALTGLPNRLLFADRLRTALAQSKRGGVMALHYIDLDKFKPVNDQLGHKAGDEVLKGVAHRLQKSVRETDTVARLGGDEFAIIQTMIKTRDDAEILADRLCSALHEPFQIIDHEVQIGGSIGIALAPDDTIEESALIQKADAALYTAKRGGRGGFVFADDASAT